MFVPGQRVRVTGLSGPIKLMNWTSEGYERFEASTAIVIDPSLPRRDYPGLLWRDDDIHIRFDGYDYGNVEGNSHTVKGNWTLEAIQFTYDPSQAGDTEEDI